MGVISSTLVVEDKFEEIFSYLPKMENADNEEFEVVFKYGDQKELIAFLKAQTDGDSPYPLIWLVYPYIEIHKRTRVELNDVSMILAIDTSYDMFNEDRMETSFKLFLFPLLDNIKELFKRANIISTDEVYTLVKYPNYSGEDNGDEETKSTDIWDAIKITFSCSIIDSCLKIQNL